MMKFKNKLLLLILLIVLCMGCLYHNKAYAKGKNFSGTWVATKEDSFGRKAKVIIKKDIIKVYWITDSSKTLYWYGSWEPKKKKGKYVCKSENDHDKTDLQLFASGDDYKKFTYKDGIISFKSSMMGTTDTIKVKKKNKK